MALTDAIPRRLQLHPGELVRVRSAQQIATTLDHDGRLDGLPFMPEMLPFCGRTMVVYKTAKVTCDGRADIRGMDDAVFLTGVRCDGAAHGGCQARCLLHWKEAWLERVDADTEIALLGSGDTAQPELDADLLSAIAPTTQPAQGQQGEDDEPRYLCQATEIRDATTPMPFTRLEQYPHHVRNWGLGRLVRTMLVALLNKVLALSTKLLPERFWFRGGLPYPFFQGTLTRTPVERTGLEPGDLVRIRSREEILATLDADNANRGLIFDVEELRFCGQTARVLQRVEQIIDERSGRMVRLGTDALMLDGIVCPGDYHRLCARSIYSYWREIWLEKLPEEGTNAETRAEANPRSRPSPASTPRNATGSTDG